MLFNNPYFSYWKNWHSPLSHKHKTLKLMLEPDTQWIDWLILTHPIFAQKFKFQLWLLNLGVEVHFVAMQC